MIAFVAVEATTHEDHPSVISSLNTPEQWLCASIKHAKQAKSIPFLRQFPHIFSSYFCPALLSFLMAFCPKSRLSNNLECPD
jgi:hypothetical protein